jgi:hypothetical protein
MDTNQFDSTYAEIAVSDLDTDSRIQRPLDPNKVGTMVKNFNPDAVGTITVSRRKDRSNIIVDGQHRVEVVRRVTGAMGSVYCRVFTGLTLLQEAMMFLALNNTTKPRYVDKYKVRVTAGDEVAIAINEIVKPYGFAVTGTVGNGNINAVAALERVYKLSQEIEADPNLVQLTVLVINSAWGQDRHGVQGPIMEGIGRFLGEYGSSIELDRLIDVLKNWRGGPEGLTVQMRTWKSAKKVRAPMAVADIITDAYNVGLRARKLPSWRKRS